MQILQARLSQAKHEHALHKNNFTVINNIPLCLLSHTQHIIPLCLLSHTQHITVYPRLSRVMVGRGGRIIHTYTLLSYEQKLKR